MEKLQNFSKEFSENLKTVVSDESVIEVTRVCLQEQLFCLIANLKTM